MFQRTFLCMAAAIGLAACAAAPDGNREDGARPWPAAERLFRGDARWRGGDAAYAVPLGGERTLWLFGDSFVARGSTAQRRTDCAMVRNSIAVQTGSDPATARLEFAWRGDGGEPHDWLPRDGAVWSWPLHGLRIGPRLVVFCTRVASTGDDGPFGFRAAGWTAFVLGGIDGAPASWTCKPAQLPPPVPFPVVVGTAVVDEGEHIVAFALREPGDHALFLVRWRRDAFARGDLREPQWFSAGAWLPQAGLRSAPPPVLADGAPEFTVVRRPGGGFAMVQSLGFGRSDVVVRTSEQLAGPWSPPRCVFHPPQSDDPAVLTYAAKALSLGDGTALVTYASNAQTFARLLADESIYYPHCLRLALR